VEAKGGNLIVDVADVRFDDGADIDIRAGEAVEATGKWPELTSFDEFDADPLNYSNDKVQLLFSRIVES